MFERMGTDVDRTILHCDCNSFYASVETLLDPTLADGPSAVCGDPESRHGIILAKNEKAKAFGVQTAETIWQAKRKCPDLRLVAPHRSEYVKYSRKCNELYLQYTDLVDPFGIDESFLDVTGSMHLFGTGEQIADELRRRMVADLRSRRSAVSEEDYEQAVRQTPGLCIHKVRAVADEQQNLVRITVKCHTEDNRPELPACYLEQIKRQLDDYRMIATRIELRQPQYVPVDVTAVVHVRNYYENARAEITDMLRRELDYITSDHSFGETIRFTELYRKLETMQCVDSVYMLSMQPAPGTDATLQGADIVLGESSLCHLGRLTLEINTSLAH